MPDIRLVGISGIPEIKAGDDLAALIVEATGVQNILIEQGEHPGGYPKDRIQGRKAGY